MLNRQPRCALVTRWTSPRLWKAFATFAKIAGFLAAMFAKAGELMIGPSWVLFTVMGHQYFHVHLRGVDPQRGAMLGMSLLLGARGIGAVMGPLFSARWAGHSDNRLRLGILLGYLTIGAGYLGLGFVAECLGGVPVDRAGSLWRINRLGFFHYAVAVQHRRPLPRPRLLRRPRLLHADHRDRRLCLWIFSRPWSVGASRGLGDRPHHAGARVPVGVGDEIREALTAALAPGRRRLTSTSRSFLGWIKLVDLGRHDEVALGQAVDLVRPHGNFRFAPGQQDVGMMSLLLRDLSHPVHEVERLLEIRER